MGNIVPDIVICSFIIGTFGIVHLLSNFLRLSLGGSESELTLSQLVEIQSQEYGWLLKLLVNSFGYSCVFVPGILVYKYINRTNYLEKTDPTLIHKAVQSCLKGTTTSPEIDDRIDPQQKIIKPSRTATRDAFLLAYCFFGLMGSYLTWGVLQEKIMTQEYTDSNGKKSYFKDSQFLVFTNRLLAFFVALLYIILNQQSRHRAPLYKYSYASFSNIMSAWFQYEALKFVNFPTQVLAKSCKIIPVMLMGKIISRTKYECYEYFTAGLISVGMILFMTGSTDEGKASSVTTLTGVFLLAMYMIFDSFTANWQGDLFKSYGMSSIQMMCGVNLFSSIFTAASLLVQGGFWASFDFAVHHPKFVFDCVVLSISSAVGQLFIFYTISVFGPVIFTIIMTLRQAVAIMLSCFIYNHSISAYGIVGVCVVFLAIFIRVYCNHRLKLLKKRQEASRPKMQV
ncbi:adenosine 3'-phospho 5'-phosphosulfate transporter 1 [Condylostylus longicornis]|uniref:adenosine 3'-phospho 5'-phosphosulfate transporter 1 n=1 Tax=Condylostylus longicornis TaxID=2530218 RepID=UPI00244DC5D9|nr:adenosine 3'-phospho 5'-phosphosulfate transporter 1 [Condylostylus longicornis]